MPKPLPDCPFCDAKETLALVCGDYGGSAWSTCSCCARTCLVKDGRVVHPAPRTDVSGVEMTDP